MELEGLRQRIAAERHHRGKHTPRKMNPVVAKFMENYHQSVGNRTSAAAGQYHNPPLKKAGAEPVDASLPSIPQKNFGRNKNYFFSKDSVHSCLVDHHGQVQLDREVERQRIKDLKSQIRSERRARRQLSTPQLRC